MARTAAAARAKRMLAILHLLEPGATIPLKSVASALGADVAEIIDDLNALACCGVAPYSPDTLVPVYIEDGMVVVWGRLPALEKAARLSTREAHAIVTALGVAGLPADDPLVTRLLDAAAVNVSADRIAAVLQTAPSGGQPVLKTLALALAEQRVVRLLHQGTGSATPRARAVEPISFVNERGQWYLEAFCRTAGALRTFRLDRIREAEVLEERAPQRRLSPTGAAFVVEGLPLARIRLDPGEDVNEHEWPGARVIERKAQGMLVDVPYGGTAWIARQVVARLGHAEAIAPAEVRDAVRTLAEDLARG